MSITTMRIAPLCALSLGLVVPLCAAGKAPRAVRAASALQNAAPPAPDSKLTEQDKLEILRAVDGEFAKAVRPLPSLKDGFILKPDGKIDQKALEYALIRSVPAANPGDRVQITGIVFRAKSIRVNIDGGSDHHESWRQRIHISFGGTIPTTQVVRDQPPGIEKIGATLVLDFHGPVPSVTPAELKQYLAPFLNFAEERSAARIWVDTLPPKFKKAIGNHQAAVGMNRDMVLAALGRPDHKVREFKDNGTETEDWIYGSPPGTTIFVTFIGERVVRVRQFP